MSLVQHVVVTAGRYRRRHRPDVAALRAQAAKIVPAVGATTTGPIAHCAHALADLLDTSAAILPGGHHGWAFRPRAVAASLRAIFLPAG